MWRNCRYSEENVVDVLYRGLADPEIQMDLLGDPNQDKTVMLLLLLCS